VLIFINQILPRIIAVMMIAPANPSITKNTPKGSNAELCTIVDKIIHTIPAITTKPDTELPIHFINTPILIIPNPHLYSTI